MRELWQSYLTHGSVQFLFLCFGICLAAVALLDLWVHWPWVLVVIVSAPFFEWVTHKYTLHRPLRAAPGFWRDYQIRLHHGHHRYPDRRDLQFAPISAIIVMFVQLYLSYALFTWATGANGWQAALMPLLASIAYYLIYEWVHLAHHTKAYRPVTHWGRALRDGHMRHHHHNENTNWGITNALGDLILGTWKQVGEIDKSPTAKRLSGYDG